MLCLLPTLKTGQSLFGILVSSLQLNIFILLYPCHQKLWHQSKNILYFTVILYISLSLYFLEKNPENQASFCNS